MRAALQSHHAKLFAERSAVNAGRHGLESLTSASTRSRCARPASHNTTVFLSAIRKLYLYPRKPTCALQKVNVR